MILSVIGTILVTKDVYTKWQKSPVIVSFAEKYTRVSEIPFPAVTICPETKARSSILNFTDLYRRWTDDGLETLEKEEKYGFVAYIRIRARARTYFILYSLRLMVAVLQVCSDRVNKELNEGDEYNTTDTEIFKLIQEVVDDPLRL